MRELIILEYRVFKDAQRRWHHLYRCYCGKEFYTAESGVRYGNTTSCGCYREEMRAKRSYRHGHLLEGKSSTYNTWDGMIQRTRNPNAAKYEYYGGRGISVCERWLDFRNFLQDMGERPEGKSIDRVDNDGNYEPSNCRWATRSEQRTNQRPTLLKRPTR